MTAGQYRLLSVALVASVVALALAYRAALAVQAMRNPAPVGLKTVFM